MILVKMHFSFICLLALCPVKDLHIKFQRSMMVIKQQKLPLMQVITFSKARPAASEEHLSSGRPGRRLVGAEEDAAMEITLGLFLLPRGRPRPCFSTMTPAAKSTTPVSAMEILWWIAKQARRNPNQFGRRQYGGED
jgi:hypothetical protein